MSLALEVQMAFERIQSRKQRSRAVALVVVGHGPASTFLHRRNAARWLCSVESPWAGYASKLRGTREVAALR
jgi:hypothetical protein